MPPRVRGGGRCSDRGVDCVDLGLDTAYADCKTQEKGESERKLPELHGVVVVWRQGVLLSCPARQAYIAMSLLEI